jgi:hypothetical protein
MPEIKKTFLRGRMNKDLDERLMPDGEYRDALNIQVSSTEDSDAGTAQNIRGNKLLKDLSTTALFGANAKCVGKIADEENNKFYWFIKGSAKQGIIEYNTTTDITKPVVIDLTGAILNFPDYEITGIVIIDKNLAWTDGYDNTDGAVGSEPKIIDIDDFVTYDTYKNSDYTQTTERATGVDITEADITVIKKKPITAPTVAITKHTSAPSDKSLFEDKFVRFAYRWRFKNGQYSVISPFTDPVFDPDIAKGYDLDEGFNNRMLNYISQIKLTGFDITPSNLDSIDIIYKESNNSNIYIYKTITSVSSAITVNITKESVYSIIPEKQLFRQYDNVPYKAKSLETVGNRLVFGNYIDGIELNDYSPDFNQGSSKTEFVTRDKILDVDGSDPKNNNTDRRTIKSGRSYQLGIAFEDEYGRQSPVISNDTGLIKRAFAGNAPKQLNIKMLNTAPSGGGRIKHFKFYAKDSAAEYYNFVAENVYDDNQNTSHAWISVPSYEVNKVQENDTIALKKAANGGLVPTISKYKILDISDSVPTTINDPGSVSTDGRFFIKVKKDDNLTEETISQGGGISGNSEINSLSSNWVGPIYTEPTNALYLGQYAVADSSTLQKRYRYYFKDGKIIEVEDSVSVNYTITNNFLGSSHTFNQRPTCDNSQSSDWAVINSTNFQDSTGVLDVIYFKNTNTDYPDKFFICYTSVQAPSGTGSGPAIFETVPDENILDIYYEISDSFPISQYNSVKSLSWYNAFDFGDGVEANRIKDDFNEDFVSAQVKASTTIDSPFREKTNKSGLIYSGLYNSRNDVNNLNEFNTAEKITKELNTEYGSIQKLHARNTDLIAFCEDKVLRVLANKDALFNADGNVNLVSTNNVLGQAVPYGGEYGISKDPESFATNGSRIYFSDKSRNAILRLSNDGLTVISNKGMKSYFRSLLNAQALPIVGTFDAYSDQYIISFDNADVDKIESISFKEDVDGWVSRLGFVIKAGLSINGELYSFNSGNLYKHHHPGVVRNLFYDVQYSSGIQIIMNDEPSTVKNFKTIYYEGSQAKIGSKKGWQVDTIETDLQSGKIIEFKDKEGKWFANTSGVDTTLSDLDSKEFSIQGLGQLNSYTADDLPPEVTAQPTFSNVTQTSLTAQAAFKNESGLSVTYKIYFGTNSTATSNTLYTIQTSTNATFTPSYTATGLTSNTTYYVAFVADTSEFSDVLTNTANTTTVANCSFNLGIS